MNTKLFVIVNRGALISILISVLSFTQNWHLQSSSTTVQLKGIQMLSHTSGWTCGDAGTILHTTDGGETWTSIILTGSDLHQIVFKDESVGIVVGDGGTVFTTINGGANWVSKNSNTSSQLRTVTYAGENIFYAAGENGTIIKSTDNGNTWIVLTSGTTERLFCVSAIGNNLWVGGRNGLMLFSNNAGSSFNSMSSPASDDIKDIQFISNQTGFACGSNSIFLYTSNGGANWESRSVGIITGLNGIHFINESVGWTVGGNGTLYNTTNAGASWTAVASSTGQDLNSIYSLDGTTAWAVGNSGVIISNFSPSTGVERLNATIPSSFFVEQNYPNPFNPLTKIKFGVPESSNILIEVFNITGQKVAEPVNEFFNPGMYELAFDASGLSSGVYFYRIQSKNSFQTRKMILQR